MTFFTPFSPIPPCFSPSTVRLYWLIILQVAVNCEEVRDMPVLINYNGYWKGYVPRTIMIIDDLVQSTCNHSWLVPTMPVTIHYPYPVYVNPNCK